MRTRGIRQIPKPENPVFYRIPASEPESAGFAVGRNRYGILELAVDFTGVALRKFERAEVSELFAFGGFAENGGIEIRGFQRLSESGLKFVRLSIRGKRFRNGMPDFSGFQPRKPEFRAVGVGDDFGAQFSGRSR